MTSIVGLVSVLASQPTNQWGYVIAAYVAVLGALVGYSVFIVIRGRRVGRQLPPEERRWL